MHLYSNKQSSRRSLSAINIDDYFSGNKYKINNVGLPSLSLSMEKVEKCLIAPTGRLINRFDGSRKTYPL